MSDPKPEVMQVDGGFVSREACGPSCPCNEHGVEPQPDWRARLSDVRQALLHYYAGHMGHGALIQLVDNIANGRETRSTGAPFNDRASGATPAATESRGRILTPPGVAAETELSAHHAGSVFAVSPEFAKKFPALTPCGGCDDPTCRQHWRAP